MNYFYQICYEKLPIHETVFEILERRQNLN